ncbi:MAG: DUF4231 domain-containing protein [Oscillospiraceae bacterium]|nr:DUF4231 domain-containing protein [Oscillospiraceae bacterium]
MGKKNRAPEPEKSAFDRAKAAFDRVGEDYIPASKAVELSKAEEPAETPDAAATPETPVDTVPAPDTDNAGAVTDTDNAGTVTDTDNAEAVTKSDADATPDEPAEVSDAESVEAVDSDANGVEAADSDAESVDTSDAESVEPETNADASEPADSAETQEVSVETPEASAATPEAPVSEAADTPEASEPADTPETSDSDATPETSDSAKTPETPVDNDVTPEVSADAPDTNNAAPETVDDSATPEPETVEEEETDEADDFWTFDADEPESEEVTEMEKLTMETKEITLGVHRGSSAHADTQSREQEKKPKFRFKVFDRLKDALRTRADSAEHVEQSDDNPPSSSSSARDAAIRKRVMQIDDEETRNYLLDRVLPQMVWYGKKVTQYRTMYFRLMAATILLGALIPVFSVGANSTAVKVIIAFLGASVTGINAYIALHNYRDLWLTYQTTRETLIHTLYCYFNQAGVFSHNNMSAEDLNVLLVNVCEDTLSKEHGGWTTILQKT